MKTSRSLYSILIAAVSMILFALVGCGEENNSVDPEPVTPVPGPTGVSLGANVALSPVLTWRASGQPGDSVVYDVFFGTQANPPKVASNVTDTTYAVGPLNPGAGDVGLGQVAAD